MLLLLYKVLPSRPGKDRASRLAQDGSESYPNRKVKSGTNNIRLAVCPHAKETRSHQESRGHQLNYQAPPWPPSAAPWPVPPPGCPVAGHLPSAMEQSAPTVDPSFHKIVYEEMSSHTHSSMFYTACQTFYLLIEPCPPFNADFSHSSLHRVLPKLPFPF